jgi:hypothetical protein
MSSDCEHIGNNDSGETDVHLLRRIETYLKKSGTAPARFGREAARDPCLVFDLRRGREPRASLGRRLDAYLEGRERALEELR